MEYKLNCSFQPQGCGSNLRTHFISDPLDLLWEVQASGGMIYLSCSKPLLADLTLKGTKSFPDSFAGFGSESHELTKFCPYLQLWA